MNKQFIAVSDYDGTLCIKGEVSKGLLSSINEWKKAGHSFGIATGRDLPMIMHEVKRWNIPFDFLICCNGGVAYNSALAPQFTVNLPDSILTSLLTHPAVQQSLHNCLCQNGRTYAHLCSKNSWFPLLGTPFTQISLKEAMQKQGLQQISLAYNSVEECQIMAEQISADFADKVTVQRNSVTIDIIPLNSGKAFAVTELAALNNWQSEKILAIGDGENDLSMITAFNGFTLNHATSAIKDAATGVYASVEEMLAEYLLL